jgi:hypothetical protein
MDLRPFVENLRSEFAVAADAGGPEARALADRIFTQLEAATRLTLLEALSAAADEITRELAPGSVHVRLRGREPAFVVTPASSPFDDALSPTDARDTGDRPGPAAPTKPIPEGDEGGTSRINLRLPDHLKASVEEAASQAGLSVNAWLVRAVSSTIEAGDPDRRPARRAESRLGQQFSGWVH